MPSPRDMSPRSPHERVIGPRHLKKSLFLADKNLAVLPEDLTLETDLQYLYAGYNRLETLPEDLGKLTSLKDLYLSYNRLTHLPDSLGQLSQLEDLALGHNRLSALPSTIAGLRSLGRLSLDSNELTQIPESIGELSNLVELDLSNNKLTSLPESMSRLTNLRRLMLDGNSKLEFTPERLQPVLSEKPSVVLEYYFRTKKAGRPLNEAKLILVGRGAVGKTSIVNRILHNRFNPTEKKTEGIQINHWDPLLHRTEKVRLNVWDFGGQEIMHATHQFFLSQRAIYLLVVSGREGSADLDAEYWLNLIESFGGESPVIIVLNKFKEQAFDVNRRGLQQKYPAIRDFVITDCADGTGRNGLLKVIERETDRLEGLRVPFPASWIAVKERLSGMQENYLTLEQYQSTCAELGEKRPEEQRKLTVYLHILGIALNYQDDPRLQDTHVLNPRWVTNGIYQILNSAPLEKRKGDLRLSGLADILSSKTYPSSMRRFLIDLMKKFELCFAFPDDRAHYLVPELLERQQPPDSEMAEFNVNHCLNFWYKYPILPEGLLPRFIVRTHVLSETRPRWRSGVVLQFEEGKALVTADPQDKLVRIAVKGPGLTRRRLLAIIRSDFERIHRDFVSLKPEGLVPLPNEPEVAIGYQKLLAFERAQILQFKDVVGNKVVTINVQELLEGVDLERADSRRTNALRPPVTLFYSYSHADERFRSEVETHLKILERLGWIRPWHGRMIEAGQDWKTKIDENLEKADLILLMVSSHFIASDYCWEKEMKRALQRHENGEALVVPIIVRAVSWQKGPFAKLQALPRDAIPVTDKRWGNRDVAWKNVVQGLEQRIEKIRGSNS
jgi:internalin A